MFGGDKNEKKKGNYFSFQITSHPRSGKSKNLLLDSKGKNGLPHYLQKKLYKKPKTYYGKKISNTLNAKDYQIINKQIKKRQ